MQWLRNGSVTAAGPNAAPSTEPESRACDGGTAEVCVARRVDTEISALVMRGYETARQIVERQRGAVRALAMELLDVESVDADRVKQILAQHVVPTRPLASEARDAGDARSN